MPAQHGEKTLQQPMLDAFKRLIGAAPAVDESAWLAWCSQRGHAFSVVRNPDGFVVDEGAGATAWRLEWGPAQRPYMPGPELRLRAELAPPAPVQAMVLDRHLRQTMERQVFEQYVDDVQTRVDTDMPPEMRWLVMLNKVDGAAIKAIRAGFAAFASDVPWIGQWLQGPLEQLLAQRQPDAEHPMVLTLNRSRLALRTVVKQPNVEAVGPWIAVFEAAREAAARQVR